MLPLYQVEELAKGRYQGALAQSQRTQDYDRSIRQGKARLALERAIEQNIHSGASLGELKRDMIAVLRRVAE
ncbi:hypothetical protein KKG90_11345 [Candidatus Bipolaricaulota bacterium]|nr:hypothetical protein [Candidatus Bipolaricaulota bacterium]